MNHPPHSYASTPNIICDAIGLSLLQTGNVSMPRIILVLLLSACWANSSQGEVRRPKSPTHVLGTQVLRSKRYTTPHNAGERLKASSHAETTALNIMSFLSRQSSSCSVRQQAFLDGFESASPMDVNFNCCMACVASVHKVSLSSPWVPLLLTPVLP